MITLKKSLAAWQSPQFKSIVREEISLLNETSLPLQQGLSRGNYADGSNLSVLVLKSTETNNHIQIKTGIFYLGIIAGCNCSDDPSPMASHTEYCEIKFIVNKNTAQTDVFLL
jgi:hypothetical protein